jgi:hypothetical protein
MYANFGYNPEAYKNPREGPLAEKAILSAEQLRSLHAQMRNELEFVQQRMAKYYNKKRLKGPIFKKEDKVYLLRRNIKTSRPSDKLDYKKLGPFKVEETISTTNYRLSLPKTMKIHPVFHISLLEPAPANAKPHKYDIEVYDEEFEPEKLLARELRKGEVHYLVKWKNCGHEENTWEPVRHLKNCPRLLQQFHQQQNRQTKDQSH